MSALDAVSLPQAQQYVLDLAAAGRENFAVLSRFVHRDLKADFAAVYAFCRWADDLGDETGAGASSREQSLVLLDWWQGLLDACYQGQPPTHPVFQALQPVIQARKLPQKLFDDLLDAFKQDQRITRYTSLRQLEDYCTRSADPVGRLILHLGGHANDPSLVRLSDAICTGLQLINFWQDVRRDLDTLDRIYLPLPELGMNEAQLRSWMQHRSVHASDFAQKLKPLVDDAQRRFEAGRELPALVNKSIAKPIWLFVHGGLEVVRAIRQAKYATLWKRPKVTKWRRLVLLGQVILKA
jgi:squalene synthase HpnC